MSLLSDPTFLVHQLRVAFLRSDDRTGDRILSLDQPAGDGKVKDNAFVEMTSPYPEYEFCVSPDIHFKGEYFYSGNNTGGSAFPLNPIAISGNTTPGVGARYPSGNNSLGGRHPNRWNTVVDTSLQGGSQDQTSPKINPANQQHASQKDSPRGTTGGEGLGIIDNKGAASSIINPTATVQQAQKAKIQQTPSKFVGTSAPMRRRPDKTFTSPLRNGSSISNTPPDEKQGISNTNQTRQKSEGLDPKMAKRTQPTKQPIDMTLQPPDSQTNLPSLTTAPILRNTRNLTGSIGKSNSSIQNLTTIDSKLSNNADQMPSIETSKTVNRMPPLPRHGLYDMQQKDIPEATTKGTIMIKRSLTLPTRRPKASRPQLLGQQDIFEDPEDVDLNTTEETTATDADRKDSAVGAAKNSMTITLNPRRPAARPMSMFTGINMLPTAQEELYYHHKIQRPINQIPPYYNYSSEEGEDDGIDIEDIDIDEDEPSKISTAPLDGNTSTDPNYATAKASDNTNEATNTARLSTSSSTAAQSPNISQLLSPGEWDPTFPPPESGISCILDKHKDIATNPFTEEFSSLGGISNASHMELSIFIPEVQGDESVIPKPLKVQIQKNATVEQGIGYILFHYINEQLSPPLPEDRLDVVEWTLRIAEDDGEIDDDFPVLERTRLISKFAFSTFALCTATSDQVKLNEEIRVKQGKPPRMPLPKSVDEQQQQQQQPKAQKSGDARSVSDDGEENPFAAGNSLVSLSRALSSPLRSQRKLATGPTSNIISTEHLLTYTHLTSSVVRPSNLANSATTRLFHDMPASIGRNTAPNGNDGTSYKRESTETWLVRVSMVGDEDSEAGGSGDANGNKKTPSTTSNTGPSTVKQEILRTTTLRVDSSFTINRIITTVCHKWGFDEFEYILGIMGDPSYTLHISDPATVIPKGVELCLYPVEDTLSNQDANRNHGQQSSLVPTTTATMTTTSAVNGNDPSNNNIRGPEAINPISRLATLYRTYVVTRRTQMFTRQELTLMIDGQMISLMPLNQHQDRSKSYTFNIGVVTCKRNLRMLRKFKIIVQRPNSAKSFDLEATSKEDASQICAIIERLHTKYIRENPDDMMAIAAVASTTTTANNIQSGGGGGGIGVN